MGDARPESYGLDELVPEKIRRRPSLWPMQWRGNLMIDPMKRKLLERRDFLKGMAVGSGALLLPAAFLEACASSASPQPSSAAGESGAPASATGGSGGTAPSIAPGTTINFLGPAEPDVDYVQKTIIPAFTNATGIKVNVAEVDYVKLHDKDLLEFQTTDYDVFQLDQIWLQQFQKSGYLEPLDSYFSQGVVKPTDFEPSVYKIGTISGHQYALPYNDNAVDYWYNMDMLQAKGLKPADTWDDVLNIAKETTLKDASGNVTQYGFSVRGEPGNPITWTWLPMFWAFGGQLFDDKLHPTYNSDAGIASVEYFKQLNSYSPPGANSAQQVAADMAQGRAAQTVLMSTYNAQMDDPSQSKVVGKIGFSGMPNKVTRSTVLGQWTLGVAASSVQKAAAWQFLDYLTKPATATAMSLAGIVGPTQAAIFKAPNTPRFFPAIEAVLQYASPPPLFPEGDQWFLITGTALQAAVTGQKTPKQAMDDATQQATDLLHKAGYF
jgi:ABC-type glycerol-3-phosphate transport system substrate-binding protein